jgi:hypothetical protein
VLHLALLIQDGAPAGVEERVVLERDHRGLNGVQRGTAALEDAPSPLGAFPERGVERLLVDRSPVARVPGAAVQD